MKESEKFWREEASLLPPSALRTELYEELRSMLALRELGDLETPAAWLEDMEDFFESEYGHSESEAEASESQDPLLALAELFLAEGVEGWLEAFHQFREGVPDAEVLQSAEQGQRMLLLVGLLAKTGS